MTIQNDTQRIALRPQLNLKTNESNPEEVFQNNTLRPVLKMQHELLQQVFEHYIQQRKNAYFKLPKKDQPGWIMNSIRSDLRLRNQLCGMVIGHFTADELHYYLAHEAEAARRLTDLLIQRLQSIEYVLVADAALLVG